VLYFVLYVKVVFMIFLLAQFLEQLIVVLLLKSALISQLLVKDEHGEHIDLRSSTHRNIIPYVHGRM
jgi:uncharacterized membrane protein YccC